MASSASARSSTARPGRPCARPPWRRVGRRTGRHRRAAMLERRVVGDAPERDGAQLGQLAVEHLVLGPGPDHHAVAAVEARGTRPATRAARRGPRAPAGTSPSDAASAGRLVGALLGQRPEQVLHVGEVEVEGAMRDAGQAHHVVDPGGVVAVLGQRRHRGRPAAWPRVARPWRRRLRPSPGAGSAGAVPGSRRLVARRAATARSSDGGSP